MSKSLNETPSYCVSHSDSSFLQTVSSKSSWTICKINKSQYPLNSSHVMQNKHCSVKNDTGYQRSGPTFRGAWSRSILFEKVMKLTKFAVALRLRCGSCKFLTRLQTMCNVLKYRKNTLNCSVAVAVRLRLFLQFTETSTALRSENINDGWKWFSIFVRLIHLPMRSIFITT